MMAFSSIMLAAALLTPQESALRARLPQVFAQAAEDYRALDQVATAERYGDKRKEGQLPRSWNRATRKVVMRDWREWTGGHYPGTLLYLYEATGDAFFAERAKAALPIVARNSKVTSNHDVGFIMYCSYGNARRIFKTTEYDALLLETADSLCKRYNPDIGLIRSWGKADEKRDFLVIPDNLMNLELLEWAAKAPGGDAQFDRISRSHARQTDRHHYRADSGCYHVLDYDQKSGRVQGIKRGQGASVETAWSRGQSWSVYGFTMMYRETRDPSYLARACRCADFAINHPNMPADGVPYWDYGAPGEERDTSAAAILASALLELSSFAPDASASARYRAFAVKELLSLSSPEYFARADEQGGFMLKHAVGAKPSGSEIDVPLNYGDYYFMEALLRFRAGGKSESDAFVETARRLYPQAEWTAYTNSIVRKYCRNSRTRLDVPTDGGKVKWVDVEGVCNVRDIGGWNGLRTGRAFRGSELDCHSRETMALNKKGYHDLNVTEAGRRTLCEGKGIRTDLDLRGVSECPHPDRSALGVRLVRAPVGAYEGVFKGTNAWAKAVRVFADPANYPIYFHCWGGADRTGTLAFLLQGLCGANETDLAIDYELTSFSRIGCRQRHIGPGKKPEYAEMLRRIKALPGNALADKIAYLMKNVLGLTDREIETIRTELR